MRLSRSDAARSIVRCIMEENAPENATNDIGPRSVWERAMSSSSEPSEAGSFHIPRERGDSQWRNVESPVRVSASPLQWFESPVRVENGFHQGLLDPIDE